MQEERHVNAIRSIRRFSLSTNSENDIISEMALLIEQVGPVYYIAKT